MILLGYTCRYWCWTTDLCLSTPSIMAITFFYISKKVFDSTSLTTWDKNFLLKKIFLYIKRIRFGKFFYFRFLLNLHFSGVVNDLVNEYFWKMSVTDFLAVLNWNTRDSKKKIVSSFIPAFWSSRGTLPPQSK